VPIPDYQSIMLPLLKLAADGQEHLFKTTVEELADQFGLSADERQQLLPSKTQPIFDNRVGWARTYLVKAGILESPRRGYFRMTERGRQVLQSPPARLDAPFCASTIKNFAISSRRKLQLRHQKGEALNPSRRPSTRLSKLPKNRWRTPTKISGALSNPTC
jgi:restriction system protein